MLPPIDKHKHYFPHIMMGGRSKNFAPPHRWGEARSPDWQNCGGNLSESPPYMGGFLPPKFPLMFQKIWSHAGSRNAGFPPYGQKHEGGVKDVRAATWNFLFNVSLPIGRTISLWGFHVKLTRICNKLNIESDAGQ